LLLLSQSDDQGNKGSHRNVKHWLDDQAAAGDKPSAEVLRILADPHAADSVRWGSETKLNAWQAAQAVPVVAARLTRSR